jgi:hypothetical protein
MRAVAVLALLSTGCGLGFLVQEPAPPPAAPSPLPVEDEGVARAMVEFGRWGDGAIYGVEHVSLEIAGPSVRLSSAAVGGRVELAGAQSDGSAARWTDARLSGVLLWETTHAAEWRVASGVIVLSDGHTFAVGEGSLLVFDDPSSGMPMVLARLQPPAIAPSLAMEPPHVAAPPPPVRIRQTSLSRSWYGRKGLGDDNVCFTVLFRLAPEVDAKSIEWQLALFDGDAPVRSNPLSPHPGEPVVVRTHFQDRNYVQLCVRAASLALSPGAHRLIARIAARGSVELSQPDEVFTVDMPRFYKVRLRIGDIEVKPVTSFADAAAVLTLCLSCIIARPHGTPDLMWSAMANDELFRSHARRGYRIDERERTPWWLVPSNQGIEIRVFTPRAFDTSTLFGGFSFSPGELARAIRDGKSLSNAHVERLSLDGSEVVEVDVLSLPPRAGAGATTQAAGTRRSR